VSAQPDISKIPDRNGDISALYVDAVKARMLNDTKQEETLLKEVIQQKPDEATPHYDLAKLYLKQRRYEQAEQQIEKAMSLDKENLWFKAVYADILEAESRVEEAALVYDELAAKEKFNKEYIMQAARLYEMA